MNALRHGDVLLFCRRRSRWEHKATGCWKRNARDSPESSRAATRNLLLQDYDHRIQEHWWLTCHLLDGYTRFSTVHTFFICLTYSLCHTATRATTHSTYYLPCINVMKTLFATAFTSSSSFSTTLYITNTTINQLLVLFYYDSFQAILCSSCSCL